MTYDLSKVEYEVVLLLPDGAKLHLTEGIEEMGWEENAGELAARLNISIADERGEWARAIPLCAQAALYADWGAGMKEVWRGSVWQSAFSGMPGDPLRLTLYDPLYYLQKSQANRYFAKGLGTRQIVTELMKEWNIPLGEYRGPDVKHGKLIFKSKTIARMLSEILSDAREKGGARAFARAREGKIDILPYGANGEVLSLRAEENLTEIADRYDMSQMVTRVVVVGKEDKKGRPKVEAVLDGRTEYGVLQAIEQRRSASLSEAKKAAQATLDESGQPKRTTILTGADMPAVRKGDRVYVDAGALRGYCYVLGAAHDAKKRTMRLEVSPV